VAIGRQVKTTTSDATTARHVFAHRVLDRSFGQATFTIDVPGRDLESGDFTCRNEIQGPRTARRFPLPPSIKDLDPSS
jgi:hypothetical protein